MQTTWLKGYAKSVGIALCLLLNACAVCAHAPRATETEVHYKSRRVDWGIAHVEVWSVTRRTNAFGTNPNFRAAGCVNLNPNVCAARGW